MATSVAIGLVFEFGFGSPPPPHRPENGTEFSNQESNDAFPEDLSNLNDIERIADLNAHRLLNCETREYLLALSNYLIDKRYEYGNRERAAEYLGRYGHALAIPALLAVIRDEEDNIHVRKRAIIALGMIRDKRNVMYLIEDGLGSGERVVALTAWETLARILSDIPDELEDTSYIYFQPPPGLIPLPDAEEVEPYGTNQKRLNEYLDIWRKWWRKNHEDVTLTRPLGIR